ncbi:hypothetical protein AB1Y20_003723 [Prymnesium parvum]
MFGTAEAVRIQQVLSRLAAHEMEALTQFRKLVHPHEPDSIVACWFLKGEKWDAAGAVQAYQKSLAWRSAERIDEIWRDPLPRELESSMDEFFAPRLCEGSDRKGRPIMYVPYGGIDLPTLAERGITQRHLIRRYIQEMEKLRLAIHASRDPLAGHLMIADVFGVNPVHFMRSWSFFAEVSTLGNENYPELLGCCCVVRAPPAGLWMLSRVKTLLSPDSASKIEMHSGPDATEALLMHMDAGKIPMEVTMAKVEAYAGAQSTRCCPACFVQPPPPPSPPPATSSAPDLDARVAEAMASIHANAYEIWQS